MQPSGQTLKVFLCHGSEDKAKVKALYHRLLKDGIDPWLDKEKLLPGQDWEYEIVRAVKASHVVLVCLSKRTASKEGFVQKEIKLALDVADQKPEGTIFLIPVRLEDCEIPDRLSARQWVDLFAENGYQRLMSALQARATALGVELHRPIPPP